MKSCFYAILLCACLVMPKVYAQCGWVNLTTQASVDSFPDSNCTTVDKLIVGGNDITNLDSLYGITSMGWLEIRNNPNLMSVNFANLQSVANSVDISLNPRLKDLDGLQSLTSIESLSLYDNDSLTSIDGLHNLATITEGVFIGNNPRLESLAGLEDITTLSLGLTVSNNDMLTDLEGVAVTSVGTLVIRGNAQLTSLHGLENLASVLDHCECSIRGVIINDNPMLSNIDALSSLSSVAGMVQMINNAALANVDGLSSLTSIGSNDTFGEQGIDIERNPMLTSLNGFRNVSGATGSLIIANNNALTNLDGFEKLTDFGGWGVRIDSNRSLVNINGLSSVRSVTYGLLIRGNDALQNMNGLGSLTSIVYEKPYISSGIAISNNPSLQNVDSLSSLTMMSSDQNYLTVTNNPNLSRGCGLYPLLNERATCTDCGAFSATFSGNGASVTQEEILENGPCRSAWPEDCVGNRTVSSQADVNSFSTVHGCRTLTGTLTISGPDITNLNGLSALTSVGMLLITGNENLEDLTGLERLRVIRNASCACPYNGLTINDNANLQNIDALSLVTEIGGMIRIGANPRLQNLDGLSSVTSVGANADKFGANSIELSTNATLTSIEGLRNITYTAGGVYVNGNPSLTNLNGLEGLTEINGRGLTLAGTSISNIDGLSNVISMRGGMSITNNDVLPNLDGLRHLRAISAPPSGIISIDISGNAIFANVDSLSSLTITSATSRTLNVADNPSFVKACGLYSLLKGNDFAATFSGNGAEMSEEQIIADGPCKSSDGSTCSGDITLSTQADVDAFPSTYGCSVIDGMLTVSGYDITNLDGLSQITSVDNLTINSCLALTDITGLASLQKVTEAFVMINDISLHSTHGLESLNSIGSLIIRLQREMDLSGFSGLQEINGDFEWIANGVSSLNGLGNVERINGQIMMRFDSGLVSLGGLSGVKHIGSMWIFDNYALETMGMTSLESVGKIQMYNNAMLTNFDGLSSLTSMGDFSVFANPKLTNVSGLSSVTRINGGLRLYDNQMLNSLAGLENVDTVSVSLIVSRNPALTSLAGLGVATVNGSVQISGNANLEDISGLAGLTVVRGGCDCPFSGLQISYNPKLANIDLSSLTSVRGALIITGNPLIPNLDALSNLTSVGRNTDFGDQSISISDNSSLTSINGLRNVAGDLLGGLAISNNDALQTLDGLEGITDVGNALYVSGNAALLNIDGLKNVKSASYALSITDNDLLQNLNGLASFTSLDGKQSSTVTISNNPMLTNVDSLSNFVSQSTPWRDLNVIDNPKLTKGCGLYPLLRSSYVCVACSTTVTMHGNGEGFSEQEIRDGGACDRVAPKTCDQTIRLYSQAEVDSYPATYGCSIITGALFVSGADITNVDSLYQIKTVIGPCDQCPQWGVMVQNNPNLLNVDGLSSLTTIGQHGMLMINNNASLTNLDGLSALDSVGYDYNYGNYGIYIENNPALTSIGLASITKVVGRFVIANNASLPDLDGLETLKTSGGMEIYSNNSLVNINGLLSLTTSLGMAIESNPLLENLDGLRSLVHVWAWKAPTSSFRLVNNASLTNVDSLSSFIDLSGPDRRLVVTDNPNLVRGCGFYNLLNLNFCDGCPGTATFSGNGPGVTKEEILAAGPCEGDEGAGPSVPTNLMFADVTDNSMTVSFTPGVNAVGYVTIMRSFESGLPDDGPTERGYPYQVGNVIGCCTIVVGVGTNTTLYIVYLEPDIDYYFDVIPYTLVNGQYNYFPERALSGHQRTLPRIQPYPNPFMEEITIPFVINNEANVRILISDQLGRPVSEVVNDQFGPGKYEVRWNRLDMNGNRATDGVYMYSITTDLKEPVKGLVVAK